jgi:chromosome segregation ATPase
MPAKIEQEKAQKAAAMVSYHRDSACNSTFGRYRSDPLLPLFPRQKTKDSDTIEGLKEKLLEKDDIIAQLQAEVARLSISNSTTSSNDKRHKPKIKSIDEDVVVTKHIHIDDPKLEQALKEKEKQRKLNKLRKAQRDMKEERVVEAGLFIEGDGEAEKNEIGSSEDEVEETLITLEEHEKILKKEKKEMAKEIKALKAEVAKLEAKKGKR